MANATIFEGGKKGKLAPKCDTKNLAGGKAYQMKDEHALAQYVVTGTFNDTYYAGGEVQLEKVMALCEKVDTQYIAQCALYAREKGYMKDAPALLCAVLATKDIDALKKIFPRVIDNAKMLRNFVQIVRSGVTGRKSFGYALKKSINDWLNTRYVNRIFRDSLGQSPSMNDIIKMTHPKAKDRAHEILFGYLIGKDIDIADESCPTLVRDFELFKAGKFDGIPDLDFRQLVTIKNDYDMWYSAFKNGNWHFSRMNLNNALKHGLFEDTEMTNIVASRLEDKELIAKVKVFPYQLLGTYMNINESVETELNGKKQFLRMPSRIKDALHNALEIAVENVPSYDCRVVVCPDVSGSMGSPATGYRQGSSSVVRCIDVAGLTASAVLRKNRDAMVIPFEGDIVQLRLEARDTVMTNAQKLASIGGGSTNCSAPLAFMNKNKIAADLVIYVSDNESWIDTNRTRYWGGSGGTETMKQWNAFKVKNPKAKMVCIDITPNDTMQAPNSEDIMNIGGFSDTVFDVINDFVKGESKSQLVEKIKQVIF